MTLRAMNAGNPKLLNIGLTPQLHPRGCLLAALPAIRAALADRSFISPNVHLDEAETSTLS
jgi:hypothetical protein